MAFLKVSPVVDAGLSSSGAVAALAVPDKERGYVHPQKLTLEQLDTEQFRSAELAITLKQQQKHFQEKEYSVNKSNMLLLDKKPKEQERWIQSIKMDM